MLGRLRNTVLPCETYAHLDSTIQFITSSCSRSSRGPSQALSLHSSPALLQRCSELELALRTKEAEADSWHERATCLEESRQAEMHRWQEQASIAERKVVQAKEQAKCAATAGVAQACRTALAELSEVSKKSPSARHRLQTRGALLVASTGGACQPTRPVTVLCFLYIRKRRA